MRTSGIVSVVIPHYGPAEMTERLCSQLMQQEGVELEVIVVDDCSPEPARRAKGVHVIRRSKNGGFGSAVNTGAWAASGDLLLILNSDVTLGASAIAKLVDAAGDWQPCVAAPELLTPDGERQLTRHRWPSAGRSACSVARPLPQLLKIRVVRDWLLETRPAVNDGPTVTEWLSGAVLLVPLAEFKDARGFNESFFMFGEDVDLQRRMSHKGIPSMLFTCAEMTHEGGGSTDPARARGWSLRARWTYAEAHGYSHRLRVMLWVAAAINAVWNVAARAAGRNVRVGPELRQDVRRALGRVY